MPLESRDAAAIWDMPDAALAVTEFLEGSSERDYLADRKLRSAVERQLEIIGEAARRVSRGGRESHPEIPWRAIIAHRNMLAHDYGEVRHERVWRVCADEVPALIEVLRPMLEAHENTGDMREDCDV